MTAPPRDELRIRWRALAEALGAPDDLLEAIARRYGEIHRHYHGLTHLDALSQCFDEVSRGPGWQERENVAAALFFHDAIYVPGRRDNERKSAELARKEIFEHGLEDRCSPGRVSALILLTGDHGSHEPDALEADAAHFLDCDMAVLAAPPDVYDAYEQGVRDELAAPISATLYRAGRARFLRTLLAAPSIYLSPYFRERLEAAARANLARALERLERESAPAPSNLS